MVMYEIKQDIGKHCLQYLFPHLMSLDLTHWAFKFDPISSDVRSRDLPSYIMTDDHVFFLFFLIPSSGCDLRCTAESL